MNTRQLFALTILLVLVATITRAVPVEESSTAPEHLEERVGDLHLHYSQGPGVILRAFDIPVLNTSLLAVVTPGWGDQYYLSSNNLKIMHDARAEEHDGGRRIVIRHDLGDDYGSPFTATETHAIYPGNIYRISLDFEFASDEPAILEWRVGGFNPNLVAGRPFLAKTQDLSTPGIIPYEAAGPTVEQSTVSRSFRELTINSVLGDIVIRSQPEHDLTLFDYRKNQFAMDDNPMFWFGYLERPIPAHSNLRYDISIHFPLEIGIKVRDSGAIAVVAPQSERTTVRIPVIEPLVIIPTPKQVVHLGEPVAINAQTTIFTGPNPGAGELTAAAFLAWELSEIYGNTTRIVRGHVPPEFPSGAVILPSAIRDDGMAGLLQEAGLEIPEHPDGYALRVGDGHVLIGANTDQGVYYAATTLVQLITIGPEGLSFRGAEITDYPSLDFRGVHALTGRDAGGQVEKAVRELLGRYKMNTLVWECQYIVWDCCPELEHPEYGMAKEDARQVVEAAANHFVDIIPLIQSLGHSEWIFTGGNNLDIAEDPETPYAYSPTNPRTYEFIFGVFQEALDFFQPSGFHIGHDEVTMRGRFPYRSRESGLSVTDLIMMDTIKLNDWFRDRGVAVYMWGDMFLHSSEAPDATFAPSAEVAAERRERLPKDITITDWHYRPVAPAEYTSLPLWRDEGFQVIGAGWYTPANIHQQVLACIQTGAKGYLQTTWAGFNFSIDDNEGSWFQYWAYILAAHYAWSGDERPPEELPFSAKDVFIRTWFRTKPLLAPRQGLHLDISRAYNRSLIDEDGTQWMGYGPDNDFRALPTGVIQFGETTFKLDREDNLAALLMHGIMNPEGEFPSEVTFEIGELRASELRFLMATTYPTRERAEVGRIEIIHVDGVVSELPLEYGRNIFAYSDSRSGPAARIVWQGKSAAGTTLRLWDIEWVNTSGNPIEAVRLKSAGTEAAPILFAITAVE